MLMENVGDNTSKEYQNGYLDALSDVLGLLGAEMLVDVKSEIEETISERSE